MGLTFKRKFRKKAHFKLVTGLFRKAGYVREVHMNLHIVDNMNALIANGYREYLVQHEKTLTHELTAEVQVFQIDAFNELDSKLNSLIENIGKDQFLNECMKSLSKSTDKLRTLVLGWDTKRWLHKARIRVRAILEILNLIKELSPESNLDQTILDFKHFNDVIGDWHDEDVLIQSLKEYSEQPGSKNPSMDLITNLMQDNHKRTAEIGTELNEYFADWKVESIYG